MVRHLSFRFKWKLILLFVSLLFQFFCDKNGERGGRAGRYSIDLLNRVSVKTNFMANSFGTKAEPATTTPELVHRLSAGCFVGKKKKESQDIVSGQSIFMTLAEFAQFPLQRN